jgi:lipopolysaccharide transport system ATP-binding protein
MLQESLTAPFRNWRKMRQPTESGIEPEDDVHWALRDVSFEVKEGEVLGIIGRNGAGKSTLLKILSRITEPTSGAVRIRGRVSSLLEVGTGFHPELSGRENIYLNGTILGMMKREIDKKFDEIVNFSGVGKFLDTPTKRYSSGMKVRLAFAVAAHLEPEVLIIDEVLAVGDAEFQKKCLGKIEDVAHEGRSVIFVTHDMTALSKLTQNCIVLENGQVALISDTASSIAKYSSIDKRALAASYEGKLLTRHPGIPKLRKVEFRSLKFVNIAHFEESQPNEIVFDAELISHDDSKNLRISFTIFRSDGTPVGSGFSKPFGGLSNGQHSTVRVSIKNCNLAPGFYYFGVGLGVGDYKTSTYDFDAVTSVLYFEIEPEECVGGGVSTWHSSWGPLILREVHASMHREVVSE